MTTVATLRHGCEYRKGTSAQVWTEAYCQAKRKTGEQNHFCERERKTEQKPEAQWKDRPGKPQAQPFKDRLRSEVAPRSFPAHNLRGNCRPEPAWKTDAERLGSMRGGNRVTVAYPLMQTELPPSAPVGRMSRRPGMCRISRISRIG